MTVDININGQVLRVTGTKIKAEEDTNTPPGFDIESITCSGDIKGVLNWAWTQDDPDLAIQDEVLLTLSYIKEVDPRD